MRRSVQPSRPKAITCCFFSSLKTLAIAAEAISPHAVVNVPESVSVGRFSGGHHWPVLGDRRGCERPLDTHQVDQTPGAVILWRHTSDPVSILCLRPYSGLAAGKGADGTGTKRGESTIKTDNVRIEAHGIREFA